MTLEPSTLINSRYRILDILGQGGMGAVYRALDENLGVEVALKENLFTSEEYARQFRREATILANLRHPNLPRVTDHFVIENRGQYLVMDYIEGEDLRQRMERLGPIPEEEIIAIGMAICDALEYLDSRTQPIVHRDIKPGNVKITSTGQIYLVDFGLAKVIEIDQMTTTGARAMTPGYSPPEQYGTTRTDHRSDLYSLGATLYAAITGSIPEDALARAMGQAELTPIRKRNHRVSQNIACALEKALAVRPDERYANANDFKQALLKAETLTGQPPIIIPDGEPTRLYVQGNGISFESGNNSVPPVTTSWGNTGHNSSRPWYLQHSFRSIILPGLILVLIAIVILVSSNLDWGRLASSFISRTQTHMGGSDAANLFMTQDLPTDFASPTIISSAEPGELIKQLTQTLTVAASATVEPAPTDEPQPTPVGGGGGEIAFVSNQSGTVQIWVTTLDGSIMRQITDMPEGACQPDWSPDGKKLAFVSPCDGNDEIYPGSGLFLINYDGTNLTPLPNMPGGDFDPAWSPDGHTIAFTSRRVSGRSRLYLIDVDTFEVTRLSGQYSRNMQPAWSSDGQKLVYISSTDGPTDIWVMNRDGTNQMPITNNHTKINSNPHWSVDDNVILFTQADEAGGVPHLTSASTNEGQYNESKLNLGSIPAREGKYSPDGLWIVFESWPDGRNHDIYISSAGGAGRTQITNLPSVEFDPSWCPIYLIR